jgi:VIT1/CCC1 family predicted Fe2+/Mn2+ transporter
MKKSKKSPLLAIAVLKQQRELDEYHIYTRLAQLCRDPGNGEVLFNIGEEERKHAEYWAAKTGIDLKPNLFRVYRTVLLARFLGLTFTLKQMEKGEHNASGDYKELEEQFPELRAFSEDEDRHEKELLNMLDEERLRYAGSIVLGLNDALVELTGALAGFTLVLGEPRLISLAGLITGISAAFSMGVSAYLSGKADNHEHARALKSALYTGAAYIITVLLLILPFFLGLNKFAALGITLGAAVLIILGFNYYLSTARDLKFRRRFLEMVCISLGVAAFSFVVGWILNRLLGV